MNSDEALMPKKLPTGSWGGLFGCLGTGLLVVGLIVYAIMFFMRRSQALEERIMLEWGNPMMTMVNQGDFDRLWDTMTTEAYRAKHDKNAFVKNYETARARFGNVVSVNITFINGTTELGAGRSYQATVTKWKWERGPEFYLTFDLVDVPGAGFRNDAFAIGGRNHQITPPEVPNGPW